jgi:NAD+ diphosphatase
MKLNLCPHCGSKNILFSDKKRHNCPDCGWIYYQNMAAAVAVILYKDNEVLFAVRAKEPAAGKLDIPGGFVDPGESAEEAAVRELMEEFKLVINPGDLMYLKSFPNEYLYRDVLYYTCDIVFTCPLTTMPEFIEKSEIRNVILTDPEAVDINDMAFDSTRAMIKNYLSV